MHTAPYFSALGLLTILHALRVIQLRRRHRVSLGYGDKPDLERMARVFGNHIEYVPIGLLLLIALEFVQAPIWYMHLCGVTLLAGRCLHAYGLGGASFRPRTAGMLLTLFSLAAGSIGVTLFSIVESIVGPTN